MVAAPTLDMAAPLDLCETSTITYLPAKSPARRDFTPDERRAMRYEAVEPLYQF